jgi:MFS family permease
MSASTTVATPPSRASSWQMWVPCIGMALCSWLSFVDRQVLAVLSPTILRETGLSAQDFGNVAFFFFVAYTLANPLWGSILDFVGLRLGMLLAVGIWTGASVSHAFVGSFIGFAAARAVLGLGEGATFPGGLRTAVESLPSHLRARGIATAFAGGTIGAIVTPLMMVPIATAYGWRSAFVATGALGILWLIIWATIARPPYLPAVEIKPAKMKFPHLGERRLWALVFSYALPAIAPGPVLTLIPIYLNRGMGVSQADLAGVLWIPPAAWGIGYFVGGWAADKFAAEERRPIGMFMGLAVCALAFGSGFARRGDRPHGLGLLRRRSAADAGPEGRVVRLPARAVGAHDRHRVRIVVARQRRPGADHRPALRPAALERRILADRLAADRGRDDLDGAQPRRRAPRGGRPARLTTVTPGAPVVPGALIACPRPAQHVRPSHGRAGPGVSTRPAVWTPRAFLDRPYRLRYNEVFVHPRPD